MMNEINYKTDSGEGPAAPRTLGQVIYNYIREAIITDKFKANQKINDKEIAALFHVSTTPVREAVLRLGAEGFLSLNSHREAVVKPQSYQEAREILHILVLLDSYAVKVALPEFTDDDVNAIQDIFEELQAARREGRTGDYAGLISAFHRRIWACVPNAFLRGLLANVQDQFLRYTTARNFAYRQTGVIDGLMVEMEQALGFIRARDSQAVQGLLMKYWIEQIRATPVAEGLREFLENSN
jgi:DNA-binding GntR family transcriptional regulator